MRNVSVGEEEKHGHILCLMSVRKADVGRRKHSEKNFQKKRKKVLTKGEWGGNISERLNEGRLSGAGKSRRKA